MKLLQNFGLKANMGLEAETKRRGIEMSTLLAIFSGGIELLRSIRPIHYLLVYIIYPGDKTTVEIIFSICHITDIKLSFQTIKYL